MMQTEEKKGMSGCLKVFLIFLALIVSLSVIAGIVIYQKAGDWSRSLSAKFVEAAGEALVQEADFPEAERQRVMAPLNNLARQIEEGNVSFMQGGTIAQTLAEKAFPLLSLRVLEVAHLEIQGFSQEEIEEAKSTFARLRFGLSEDLVSSEQFGQIMQSVTEEPSGEVTDSANLKVKINTDEIRQLLSRAKSTVDSAGVPEIVPPIDYASELQKAIDIGLKRGLEG